MKVCMLFYHLTHGGIQRAATTLANGLALKEDVSLDFVLLQAKGEYLSRLSPKINVIDLGMERSYPPSRSLLLPGSPLLKYLNSNRPDTVFCLGHVINRLMGWEKLLHRLTCRLLFAERLHLGSRIDQGNFFQRWFRTRRARFLYRQADICVGVSRGVTDDLVERGIVPREKACTIYNPVYRPELLEQADEPVDHQWMQSGEPPVVLAVGRLVAEKAIDDLIRAFQHLRQQWNSNARLLILGDGPEKNALETLAQELGLADVVHFPGFVANPYAYMSKAGLLALPSLYEGLPNAVTEALSCGCNVVATDCAGGGPREILEGGRWGRLVPMRNVEALAEAMHKTLLHPLSADILKKRAEYFSEERSIEQYYGVLCELKHKNTVST